MIEHFYAGIGSRQTPEWCLQAMRATAWTLYARGWTLRSGGAEGADTAFESHAPRARIFKATNDPNAHTLARKYHPNWGACNAKSRQLHARNMQIITGLELNDPVKFVACWTRDGELIGGTAQALRYAMDLKIPIYNFAIESQYYAFEREVLHERRFDRLN